MYIWSTSTLHSLSHEDPALSTILLPSFGAFKRSAALASPLRRLAATPTQCSTQKPTRLIRGTLGHIHEPLTLSNGPSSSNLQDSQQSRRQQQRHLRLRRVSSVFHDVGPSPRLRRRSGDPCQVIFDPPKPRPPHPRIIQRSVMAILKELREPHLHLRFHTTPTADTRGTSVILEFAGDRYLIGNAHEGISRVFTERPTPLSKFSDIVLAGRTDWRQQGGLMGLILTLADARGLSNENTKANGDISSGKARLKVHGGPNITYTLATARKFIFRQDCQIDVDESHKKFSTDDSPSWCDENVQAWALAIDPDEHPQIPESSQDAAPPAHSRKRSFDDYVEPMNASHPARVDDRPRSSGKDAGVRDFMMLKSIVSQMFASDWRLDALFEKPLSEVEASTTIFVKNPDTKDFEKYQGPQPGTGVPLPDIKVWVRKPWPGATVMNLPKPMASATAMSYIIKDYPRRGKVDPAKIKALGLKGPQIGVLASGKKLVNADLQEIAPEDILGDPMPAAGFAFVDLPTRDYVARLVERPEWRSPEIMEGIGAVIWSLGPGVTQDLRLQAFVQEFPHLDHVISSPDHCSNALVFQSVSATAVSRNRVDPDRYGVPVHSNATAPLPPALSSCKPAVTGLKINLRKSPRIDTSEVVRPLNTAKVVKNVRRSTLDASERLKRELLLPAVQHEIKKQDLPNPESEVITLGTGAARPSKYRALSGTLLRVPGIGSYLFDCGENTLGQLGRVYSEAELVGVLRDLRMVFISHMHADHHLGLTSVIRAWHEAVHGECKNADQSSSPTTKTEQIFDPITGLKQNPRLFVVSEPSMIEWLNEYAAVDDYGHKKLGLVKAYSTHATPGWKTDLSYNDSPVGFNTDDSQLNEALKSATGLINLEVAKVPHCAGSQGVSLTFPTGLKVSYSGDCRPSQRFVEIGRGSTLLIHEATFEDDQHGHAIAKKHSTISEAIGVGLAMGAKRLILTHISSRYDAAIKYNPQDYKPPQLEEAPEAQDTEPVVSYNEDPAQTKELHEPEPKTFDPSYPGYHGARESKLDAGMKIGAASDYMRVKLKDIMLLEKYESVMQALSGQSTRDLMKSPSASPRRRNSFKSPKQSKSPKRRSRSRSRERSISNPLKDW